VTTGSIDRAGARPVTEIRSGDGIFGLELDSVWVYRELLFFLVWREIKIRYKQAGLGIAWAIIQPLLAVLIFTAVENDCRMTALSWTGTKEEDWPIYITDCELFDGNGVAKTMFEFGDRMVIRLKYATRTFMEDPNFIVAFVRSDGVAACNYSTEVHGIHFGRVDGPGTVELELPPLNLVAELYSITVLIRERGFQQIICGQIAATFRIRHHLFDTNFGVFHTPGRWRIGNTQQRPQWISHGNL
jgi:Wzt C-terminal domain